MSKRDKEAAKKNSRLPLYIFNFALIALAGAITIGALSYLLIQAFELGIGIGVRSLLASLLPIIVITAFRSFVKTGNAQRGKVPFVNIYIIFTVLTIISFLTVRFFNNPLIPLAEVLLSFIIVSVGLTYNNAPFKSFLSRVYGIVSGFLVYVIFFELPF